LQAHTISPSSAAAWPDPWLRSAAAAEGWRVAFIAPAPPRQDGRTTALLSESIDLLSSLDVWQDVRGVIGAVADDADPGWHQPPVPRPAGVVSFARAKSISTPSATTYPTSPCLTRFNAATASESRIDRFEAPW
jgi:2-octaprenyl-6-methoxyphenol hydroxylase